MGRPSEGDRRGAVADPDGQSVAGPSHVIRQLEDRLQPHRRWSADGTWVLVLDGLRTGCDVEEQGEWIVAVDATVIRAHQHAAGARKAPPADVATDVVAPTVLTGG